MTPKTVYVSGGMTNLPEFNFPTFHSASAALRAEGFTVFSPAENDIAELSKRGILDVTKVPGYAEGDVSRYNESIGDTKDLFRWDFKVICEECSGIVMLPGWEKSTGARWERVVAEALGLDVWLATNPEVWDQSKPIWEFRLDNQQDRLSQHLRSFGSPNTGVVGHA